MASSSLVTAPLIVHSVLATRPRRILDLGFGTGKYGYLLREQHDLAKGRRQLHLTGIEGHAPNIGEIQRLVYDEIIVADILDHLRDTNEEFDVALALDVIEHLPAGDGLELVRLALARARFLYVVTPSRYFPQDTTENDLQIHRSWWPRKALRAAGAYAGARTKTVRFGNKNVAAYGRTDDPPLAIEPFRRRVRARVRSALPEEVVARARGQAGPTLTAALVLRGRHDFWRRF